MELFTYWATIVLVMLIAAVIVMIVLALLGAVLEVIGEWRKLKAHNRRQQHEDKENRDGL